MRLYFLLILLANNFFFPVSAVRKVEPVTISGLSVTYQFGLSATFEGQFTPAESVQEIYLVIQPKGATSRVESVPLSQDGHISFSYDLSTRPLRPFSPVDYWFRMTLTDGSQIESNHSNFLYEDNRFDWQYIDSDAIIVKWYTGDLNFGQTVMDAAVAGLEKAQELVNAPAPQPLRVYVYPAASDLQEALALVNATWLAGHASPEFGTVLVSVAPGPSQRLELERQLPHEITHILLYQAYGSQYTLLPQWLNEGLASLSELYPNSDYKRALQKGGQSGTLLPIQSLCNTFPREASGAYLAYAESESFVRYLSQKYGYGSLHELSKQYADGVECLQGIQNVYGTPLEQLETRWKQEALEIDAEMLAWQSLLPYLAVLLIVLIPSIIGGFWIWRRK